MEVGHFPDRLKEAIGDRSARWLADAAGVGASTLHQYLKGQSEPTRKVLIAIANATDVRLEWLAEGVGAKERHLAEEEVTAYDVGLNADEYSLVPRYDVEVSAGHGCWPDREDVVEKMAFRRSWLQRLNLQVKNLVLVTARGDSMEPTFHDGDLLLVDLDQTKVIDGGISIVRSDELLLAKRLQAGLGDQVFVCSDNSRYQRLETIKEDLNIVGRVVWRGGKM